MTTNPTPSTTTETVTSHGGRVETTTTKDAEGSVVSVAQTASVVLPGEEIVGLTLDVI
jgi:hypothetical protein